jgi:hypothetical protein
MINCDVAMMQINHQKVLCIACVAISHALVGQQNVDICLSSRVNHWVNRM